MFPESILCPRCNCNACYPLHRKGMDWAISLLGLRPARCLTCSRKFYARYKLAERAARPETSSLGHMPDEYGRELPESDDRSRAA